MFGRVQDVQTELVYDLFCGGRLQGIRLRTDSKIGVRSWFEAGELHDVTLALEAELGPGAGPFFHNDRSLRFRAQAWKCASGFLEVWSGVSPTCSFAHIGVFPRSEVFDARLASRKVTRALSFDVRTGNRSFELTRPDEAAGLSDLFEYD